MARIAINGMGRMGKLVLRAFIDQQPADEIVLLNDSVGDAALHAHMLEFDSVHGRWETQIADCDLFPLTIHTLNQELYAHHFGNANLSYRL